MEWKQNMKRALAVLLAASAVLACPQTPALLSAMAASVYGLKFYDKTSGAEEENTQIVEGSSINIRAALPATYQISVNNPFTIRVTGDPAANTTGLFDIKADQPSKYYTLIAQAMSSGTSTPNTTESSKEYTLDAIYTALLNSGSGYGRRNAGTKPDNTPIPAVNFVLDAQAQTPVAVTEDSTLKFTTSKDETVPVNDYSVIEIDRIKATGGFANDFDETNATTVPNPITSISINKDGAKRYFTLNMDSHAGSAAKLRLKVYILGWPEGQQIPEGTTFEISFIRETLNTMILTVISPKKLVNDAAAGIQQNPLDPNATGTGKPYIQLANGESLQSVLTNFNMYSRLHRLNVDIDIGWKWVPVNPAHQGNVEIKQKQGSPTMMVFDIINRPQEDMKGKLVATVTYNGVTSDERTAEIPITIYGTGLPPTIIPMYKWTGSPTHDSGTNEQQTPITELPKILDVYRGNANPDYYPNEPLGPFKFSFSINFGSGRGAAESLKIKNVGGGGEVEVRVDGSPVPYKWDTELPNQGANRSFEVTATKMGQVALQFQFFDANGDSMTSTWKSWSAYVNDTSPQTDGRLDELNLRGYNVDSRDKDKINEQLKELFPDHVIPYGFEKDQNDYPTITVPNKVDSITLQPRVPGSTGASDKVLIEVVGDAAASGEVKSDSRSKEIKLTVQIPKVIKVTVTAQDGSTNTYTLRVTRQRPDSDASLKDLQVSRAEPAGSPNLITGFSPTTYTYNIDVPYTVDKVKVEAEPNSSWATVEILPKPKTKGILFWKSEEYVEVNGIYDPLTNTMKDNVTKITVTVTSEEGTKTVYTVNVTRLAPDNERRLSSLAVLDADGKPIEFLHNGKPVTFSEDNKNYVVEIPYSTKKVTFQAMPLSESARSVTLGYPPVYNGGKADTKNYLNVGTPLEWYSVDISQKEKPDEKLNQFVFNISVMAESGNVTEPPYTIQFDRVPPDTENALASLALEDQDGAAITDGFSFNPELLDYEFTVPYLTKTVKVTPVAVSKVASVTVNGTEMTEAKNYSTVQLDTGKVSVVTIVVTAEDASTRTYTLRITRSKPSSEARLSSLTVGALALSPKFVPAKTAYSVTIPEGTKGYAVTATTVDPYATLTIADKAATSGTASETITPVEAITKVEVVVTAQDGKTKKTYTLTVTDDNLVEKSSNADLRSLEVSPSDFNTRFKPSDLEYEAYVKEDVYSVDIEPVAADRHAKVEVYVGSRKVGDYNGNYSTSLIDDENEIRVEVTSSDKTVTNKYYVTVYRNNEEKQGTLKQITAEMVDYAAESPIVVDISKYHIVAADVFNTLKTSYPDKSIVFQGNDYSLEVKGADLKRLVPNTEQFDFSVSFTSPEEDEIWDVLGEYSRNDDIEPVFVYFEHHGELPAPMKFTLSLGREYRNDKMYWNYYNQERERIDYYGGVNTNSKGTFSVQLTHMSTYLVVKERVAGAEDRTGMGLGAVDTVGDYAITLTNGKDNPNTGEDGE